MAITLKELAKLAGVSHTSVSLVLRGLHAGRVSDEKRRAILRIVRKHGYRPNFAARGLVQKRTYRMAVCIFGFLAQRPLLGQFSFHEALALAARQIHDAGYALELIEASPGQRVEETCRSLSQHAADGFALLGWPAEAAEKVLLSLKEKRIPAAAIGTALADDGLTWADVDRVRAIVQATALLLGEGRSRIALLDLDVGGQHRQAKEAAFLAEADKAPGRPPPKRVFKMAEPSIEEAFRVAREAMDSLPGLEGAVLTDHFFADAVVHELRQRGMEPGKACRLIGLGDTVLAERTRPPLTHYSLMVAEQVAFALDALLEEAEDPNAYSPKHRVFEPRLVQGGT